MNDKLCGAKQECVVLDSILEFCPVRYKVLRVELLHVLPSLRPHCSNFCLWPLNVFLTGLQLVLQWLTGCVWASVITGLYYWTGLRTGLDYWTLISMH